MTIRDGDFVLVDYDHASGRSVWSYYDGEKTVYRVDYPIAETIQQNADERSASPAGWRGDWHKIASIPLNLAHNSGIVEAVTQHDGKFLSRFLNDGDNRAWRTKEGRV